MESRPQPRRRELVQFVHKVHGGSTELRAGLDPSETRSVSDLDRARLGIESPGAPECPEDGALDPTSTGLIPGKYIICFGANFSPQLRFWINLGFWGSLFFCYQMMSDRGRACIICEPRFHIFAGPRFLVKRSSLFNFMFDSQNCTGCRDGSHKRRFEKIATAPPTG